MRKTFLFLTFLFLIGTYNVYSKEIVFEGILLEKTPYDYIGCGIVWTYQAGKFQITKTIKGTPKSKEFYVIYSACDGDIFSNIEVGSVVKITAKIYKGVFKETVSNKKREDFGKDFYYFSTKPNELIKLPQTKTKDITEFF